MTEGEYETITQLAIPPSRWYVYLASILSSRSTPSIQRLAVA